ncbi:hypothetical protein EV126DRAFT_447444 [Verticillium dahliae]|nr:hypothetical protein EV126DRAFT_447444 [Verticillium dahliae]
MPRRRRESQRLAQYITATGHPDGLASHPSGLFQQVNADNQRRDLASQRQPAAKSSPPREHDPPHPAIPRKSSLRRHKKQLRAESSPPTRAISRGSKKLQNMLAATEALKPHARNKIPGCLAYPATAVRKISAPLELGGGSYLRGGHYAVDSERSLTRFESLSDHSDATNTFTDPSLLACPKTPTRQTGIVDPVTPVHINPFDSDPDFSTDLNAVLSDRPLGASTPRTRRKEVPNAPIGTPSLGQQLVRDRAISKNTPILPRPDAVKLESFICGESCLCSHPGSTRQKLAMSQYLTKSEASACTPLSLRKSRIPGPVRSTRSEARFGLMAHPLDPGATELDELA